VAGEARSDDKHRPLPDKWKTEKAMRAGIHVFNRLGKSYLQFIASSALASIPAVALLFGSTAAVSASADEIPGLTAEQSALANQALAFLSEMDRIYFGRIAELNGGLHLEVLEFPNEYADHQVQVARGPVVEKAGRMRVATKKPTAEFQEQRLWSRFFSVDVHPKSPLVGMLHAAFVMHFNPDGTSAIGGWVDVLPGASPAEDLEFLKQTMDAVFVKHDVDGAVHRKMSCEGTRGEGARRRKPACVGGSFYGRDMMSVSEETFRFMTDAYSSFLQAYLSLIEKRQDDAYAAADIAAQDAMRRNWLEDRFFSDPFTGNVVPYEVWSLSTLPPAVKF
jgi:coproporphyrinogen III oxidase